jgi:hypothetical protein
MLAFSAIRAALRNYASSHWDVSLEATSSAKSIRPLKIESGQALRCDRKVDRGWNRALSSAILGRKLLSAPVVYHVIS